MMSCSRSSFSSTCCSLYAVCACDMGSSTHLCCYLIYLPQSSNRLNWNHWRNLRRGEYDYFWQERLQQPPQLKACRRLTQQNWWRGHNLVAKKRPQAVAHATRGVGLYSSDGSRLRTQATRAFFFN